ncbi:MAG TPA: hypothetical protein VKA70_07285 [Blastocatellia bacterium]|nr:hypothetical protein [Blastocatellia bacterium]
MSRLDFAPKIDDIKVTEIKRGLGVFTPKPDKAASFAALKTTLKKAGYTLDSAEITVAGVLAREGSGWWIDVEPSKQRFALEGENIQQIMGELAAGSRVEITGDWQTAGKEPDQRETIRPRAVKRIEAAATPINISNVEISLRGTSGEPGLPLAPVRTTSPGLTVYKGGAVMPRYFYARQHLGGLKVDRHSLRVGVSYTPTSTLQLEAEVPFNSTSFDDESGSGSGRGLGNITAWAKHRFFRTLETWGDKQAAVRVGLELPTGKKDAPRETELAAPEFVRRQLGAIDGGFAVHADVAYSQARHRWIYGANLQGTLRGERDGFRLGNEVRLNTDLEYVLLPFKYRSPTKELFLILETTAMLRDRGRALGRTVAGSSAAEFYLAPALQYIASARLVLEASLQLPISHSSGAQALRTDKNLLIGVRYLY